MGKLDLTKNSKKKGAAVKGNSGIPNWLLSTIIIVVVAAVLLACGASMFANSGLVMRMSMAMESEDYRVNGNMMAYFYANTFSSFANNYSSLLSYTSIGANSTMEIHKATLIVDSTTSTGSSTGLYDSMLTSSAYVGKTWFDYFMDQTKSGVKSMLIYCEEADERGIELTKEEKDNIKTALDNIIAQYKIYGYSESAAIKILYGEGISKKDIIKAMELASLAEKCSAAIYEEIEAAITEGRIDEEYATNSNDYNVVDYFYYSFKVTYSDVAKEYLESKNIENNADNIKAHETEILALYKEKIAKAKENAAELEKITELAKFQEHAYKFDVSEDFQDIYDKVVDDLKKNNKLTSDQIPLDKIPEIKEKMVAAAVAQVLAGDKEYKDDVVKTGDGDSATYTLYDISITKEFASAADAIKEDVFDAVMAVKTAYTIEKGGYADSDFGKWAFEGAKENEIKGFETGDGADDKEVTSNTTSSFDARVYYITKAERRDEDKAKDLAYMLFTGSSEASKAIENLKTITNLTKEQFETVATESKAAAQTVYEDYIKGALSETNLDTWLYADDRKVGDFSNTAIVMSDSSYMVAYYVADGDEVWKVQVRQAVTADDVAASQSALEAAHGAKIDESGWTLSRVGG